MRGWLNAKPDPEFDVKCAAVCSVYHDAAEANPKLIRTVSIDEMTGIQALERIAESKPMQPAKVSSDDTVSWRIVCDNLNTHASEGVVRVSIIQSSRIARQVCQCPRLAAVQAGHCQFVEETREPFVEYGETVAGGAVADRAGQPALPDAGRANNQ